MLLVLPACGIPGLRRAEVGPELPAGYTAVTPPETSSPVVALVGGVADTKLANVTTSSESSAEPGVVEFYNDPTLTGLIAQAMTENRELKVLNEEVELARNEILARRGAYLPFVTIGGSAGLERASLFTPMGAVEKNLEFRPGERFPDPMGMFTTGLNCLWTPDIWRQLRNARDAAIQRYIAAEERRTFL